jgi:Leucine-rich repeat (LRR) protein
MKTFILIPFILVIINASIMANEPVLFADPELKEIIAKKLGVSEPNHNDMLALTELNVNAINDLGGMEYARNLTSLRIDNTIFIAHRKQNRLSEKRIEDISVLSSLSKLSSIELIRNHITDISPLKSLTNLKKLNLKDNQISDISALSELSNLEQLDLSGNSFSLSNISALTTLSNLTYLNLACNNIRDINSLSMLNKLKKLDLNYNTVSDISALSNLKQLQNLYLHANQIQDITPLKKLENLSELNLRFNNLSDISVLSSLPNLKSVDIRNNPYYVRRFVINSVIIAIIIIIINILIQIYLRKYRPDRKKLCLRTKFSILCCFLAPLILWFSGFKLQYLLPIDSMIEQNNLFVLGPVFVLLIAGDISVISALWASKNNQVCMNCRNVSLAVIFFLIVISIFCCYFALYFLLRYA